MLSLDKYYITSSPLSVRLAPNAQSKIVNILKSNTVVCTVSEDSGWLKTISGQYILKSEYIEPLDLYNKRMIKEGRKNKVIQISRLKPKAEIISTIPRVKRSNNSNIEPYATVDDVMDAGSVRVPGGVNSTTDTYIPEGVYCVVAESYNKDRGTVKIQTANGPVYEVKYDNLQVMDPDGKDLWVDVKPTQEDQHKEYIDSIIEYITSGSMTRRQMMLDFNSLNITHARSIYGMPYQFTPIVDNRIDGSYNSISFGRKYAEKIVARMPMMVMQAGVPEFLQGYSDDDKTRISEAIMEKFNFGKEDSDLNNIVNQSGKYYALKITSEDYYDCVNPMCRAIAMLLGLEDVEVTINGTKNKLGEFRWQDASQNPVWGYYQGSVAFYINSDAQIQETFSNGTTQSQLANRVNQLGAMGQEVQFLLGGVTNATGFDLASFGKESLNSEGKPNFSSANGVIDNLIANAKTLIAGGKMIFPEIWSDSQFMRSYNVTIKLDSPDCDNLSIFLNILVPFCHILGFVQPRRVGSNVYISPFLLRAFYKSMFHIDMGLITECSVTKGDVGAWNQNGLPTQMTINLTIKDLYNVLSMSTNHGTNDLIGNPSQLDYLANLCGVNINEPDIFRTLKLWYLIRGKNRITDAYHSAWSDAINQVYKKWYNLTEFGRVSSTM